MLNEGETRSKKSMGNITTQAYGTGGDRCDSRQIKTVRIQWFVLEEKGSYSMPARNKRNRFRNLVKWVILPTSWLSFYYFVRSSWSASLENEPFSYIGLGFIYPASKYRVFSVLDHFFNGFW